jgi:diguanylate cyclase (GGDEF)-like protein
MAWVVHKQTGNQVSSLGSNPSMHDFVRRPIIFAIVFAACFLAGKLALLLASANPVVSPVWPAAGIALATFLLGGYEFWPAVFLGSFLVTALTAGSVATAFGVGAGHTVEGLLGAYLIRRAIGSADVFNSAPRIFRCTAVIAIVSTPVGATFGVSSLVAGGHGGWTDYQTLWMTWWLADLAGALLVAPLLVLWAARPRLRWRSHEAIEAAALFLLLAAITLVIFGGVLPAGVRNYPLEFLCGPFLVWAAFRFGRREVASVMVLIAVIAASGTVRGAGPFVRQTADGSLLLLQAYLSVTAVMALALAAVVGEHKEAGLQLRELSMTDPLTGLANYRRLIEVLRAEIVRSDRTRRPFAVLFLDMNGLKRVNDRYGYLAGSRALCRVADTLRRTCRATDTAARFGGDEFAVVLPETGDIGGQQVAVRLSERLLAEGGRPAVTISSGVAEYPRDGGTPAALLGAADRDLAIQKQRNAPSEIPLRILPAEADAGTPTLVGL